ncbi:MAG TPA: AAA family ATPase [Acidimicrobiales bacterium]|jgi:hypothetical protein|nr:AAA family ATPase [Acidimicrobiales bacterium]
MKPVADLMARWRGELTAAGHPPAALAAAVDAAAAGYRAPQVDLDQLVGEVLGVGGRLAGEKAFSRADVVVAVAPHLHGLALSALDEAVDAVLAHPQAVRLPVVAGAREPVWAAACVLADEERIAVLAEALGGRPGARVSPEAACNALDGVEAGLGGPLTASQRQVAIGLLTAGHSLDVVVGVAGAGKTTTLAAVRAGFEAAGYAVVGAATSGQAAKALGEGAGIDSRTVASLTWRLEQGALALGDRHVVIVDEGAMTADVDVARLLGAVERAGASMIVVGDDRQLDSVGPGGALGALAARHPGHLWTLGDNLRQADPAERVALGELRNGDVAAAVAWYAVNDRVHPVADRRQALNAIAKAWAAETAAGKRTLMLAYRRDNVEALNQTARRLWDRAGLLSGPELTAPGGRRYRAGDQVIALAPGPHGAWVTSQAAQVTAVDPDTRTLSAVTPHGEQLRMGPDDIGADRLGYGYAITAHRVQGSTVDVAHVLDDGGGRELAYVAMSRARQSSHVYVTAADLPDAAQRLAWAWDHQRRQQWVTDRAAAAHRRAELIAERDRLVATVPPDVAGRLAGLRRHAAQVERDHADLYAGTGRWAEGPVGAARQALDRARQDHHRDAVAAGDAHLGLLARRRARLSERASAEVLARAEGAWQATIGPHADQLGVENERLILQTRQLESAQQARQTFLDANPETISRISELNQAIGRPDPGGSHTRRAIYTDTASRRAVHGSARDANQVAIAARIIPLPQQRGPRISM